jgi:hypothetical protein
MFEKIKQKITASTKPTNTQINPETGVLNVFTGERPDDPNQNGGLPVMSTETIENAQPPAQPDDTLYTLDNDEYCAVSPDIIYPVDTKFYFRHADGTYYDSGIEIGPDAEQNRSLPEGFSDYRKNAVQPMRPYVPGEDLTGISVNKEDTPGPGGMIAVNPKNTEDKWYVAASFFTNNYDSEIEIGPVEQTKPKAPLVEAESLLAWLMTQPSTPENKAMRAQAGIVVDYLEAK